MSYADRIFKELKDKLKNLTDNANYDDLEQTKIILEEFIESIDDKLTQVCKDCDGDGEVETLVESNGYEVDVTLICETCRGTGKA